MKSVAAPPESTVAFQANSPCERLGWPVPCRTRPSLAHTLTPIPGLPGSRLNLAPAPHVFVGLHGGLAIRHPRSAVHLASRHDPDADTFSCRLVKRRGLSGSVQWQCICNGSEERPSVETRSVTEPLQIHH